MVGRSVAVGVEDDVEEANGVLAVAARSFIVAEEGLQLSVEAPCEGMADGCK